jgi:hypothetical protein
LTFSQADAYLAQIGRRRGCFVSPAQNGGLPAVELRAAMSMVRLRQRLGEAHAAELAEARQCPAAVYGRFTQGFACPDLQDTAALIGDP